jgi:DNA replication ATP-dependent helicase Dna2
MSYFERLYRLYQSKGWEHVIGTLNEQGRMHTDIMKFANTHVYNGLLRTVDIQGQSLPMSEWFDGETSLLFNERLIYVPSSSTLKEAYMKTNKDEARITIALISEWQKKLDEKKLNWTIGVITPFRAQIAAITHLGHQMNMDLSRVTIDTVERYQGGARDIIIMSCAVNSQQTLSRITSVNADGVDRKLNVAVTRARQQFILIGQKEILQNEVAYRALTEMSKIYKFEPKMEANVIP